MAPTAGTERVGRRERAGTSFIWVLHEIEVWEWHANRVSVQPLWEVTDGRGPAAGHIGKTTLCTGNHVGCVGIGRRQAGAMAPACELG